MKSMTIRDEMCRIDGDDDDDNNYDDDAINRFISINGTFICSANDDDDDDAINRL